MVAAVREGVSMREVARRFRVHLRTVQRWVDRAKRRRLDRVDWADGQPVAHTVHRTPAALEDRVLALRRELAERSPLGEGGAVALHAAWRARWVTPPPAVRTIGRILVRRGALDGRRRVRRAPPPAGWYLPAVAAGQADVDCFDIVEGLVIQDGPEVQVLTGLALLGALPAAWPEPTVTTARILTALEGHWRAEGLPAYALFDNDPRFQGTHRVADAIGRVPRLCCSLGVVSVFAPIREPGFLGALENFNGRWQAKVWARFRHPSLAALRARSARYLAAYRRRVAPRLDAAPVRRPFPRRFRPDWTRPPRGLVIFLRRTDPQGRVTLLGHQFPVNASWPHRLVRAEVRLPHGPIRFFALRRRDPAHQPLLSEVSYRLPPHRWALTE